MSTCFAVCNWENGKGRIIVEGGIGVKNRKGELAERRVVMPIKCKCQGLAH